MEFAIDPPATSEPPRIGWRLIGLVYDIFPMLALWFVTVVAAMALHFGALALLHGQAYAMAHAAIMPGTIASFLLFVALWLVTGLYAVTSWRRGGQTIGMKPFRTYVVGPDGDFAPKRSLWIRFAVGTVALLFGFWIAWFREDRLALHDLASGTRFVRRKH